MKRTRVVVFLTLCAALLFAQDTFSIVGAWTIEYQFETDPGMFSDLDYGLTPYGKNKGDVALKTIEFRSDGTATFALVDGTLIPAFYAAAKKGYRVQIKGGSETELCISPLEAGKALAVLNWTYPEGNYARLILVLGKK
jgi:hypothetical protein